MSLPHVPSMVRVRLEGARTIAHPQSSPYLHPPLQLRCSTKYANIKSTTVYVPSLELGLSQPLSPQRVCSSPPPPKNGGREAHSPAVEGFGESQFRRLQKKLSTLSTLCAARLARDSYLYSCMSPPHTPTPLPLGVAKASINNLNK